MNRLNLDTLPTELILDIIIINGIDLELCNASKRLKRICKENESWIYRHIVIPDFPILLTYDRKTIINQLNDIKSKYHKFPKEAINNSLDDETSPIHLIIKKNYFQLFDLLIINKLINIDTLFPYFAIYWDFIKKGNVSVQLFNVINKYKPMYYQHLIYNNYHVSNPYAERLVGGGSKRTAKKRTAKKRTAKKRTVKKRTAKKRTAKKRTSKKRTSKKRTSKKRI
jgi:hypothetical protein